MKEYELVREIENECGNNQMRDVFFEEIETDDPVVWVRNFLKGKNVTLTVDDAGPGRINVFAAALRRCRPKGATILIVNSAINSNLECGVCTES